MTFEWKSKSKTHPLTAKQSRWLIARHVCSCGWGLTVTVRLEDLKLVENCLWKTSEAVEVPLTFCPFTRTENSTDGIMLKRTRKFPLSCVSTTPLISPEPDSSTRATSVSVAVSLPVKDTNKLLLTPFKEKVNASCLMRCYIRGMIKVTSEQFPSPALGRVSRTSNPPIGPCDASTKSNRKSTGLWPAHLKTKKKGSSHFTPWLFLRSANTTLNTCV